MSDCPENRQQLSDGKSFFTGRHTGGVRNQFFIVKTQKPPPHLVAASKDDRRILNFERAEVFTVFTAY